MLHVIIALASVILTTFTYFAPSIVKLRLSYVLVTMTLTSGFFLVWSEPTHMVQSCVTGIAYIGVVSIGIVAARRRLAVMIHINNT
jgi:hypothetical protein